MYENLKRNVQNNTLCASCVNPIIKAYLLKI